MDELRVLAALVGGFSLSFVARWLNAAREDPDPGDQCPYCNSQHVSGGFVEVQGPCAFQDCECAECDRSWTTQYVVDGFIGN